MLFISMYIRIPYIPNRMAFMYAVHFHVHTYSSYSQPYSSLQTEEVRCVAAGRRKFAASQCEQKTQLIGSCCKRGAREWHLCVREQKCRQIAASTFAVGSLWSASWLLNFVFCSDARHERQARCWILSIISAAHQLCDWSFDVFLGISNVISIYIYVCV